MLRSIGRLTLLLALLAAVPIAARQAQPPTFGAANRTVALYATVTSPQGRLVTDLGREDFSVDDNGKRQPLTLFSNDVQPITLIMLLDRSGSMKPNFDLEQRAAEAFVREMFPQDKARIGSFAKYIQIDPEDFTSDRDKLLKILRNDLQEDGPTPLWNAIDRAIDKLVIEKGRRVILVFTDGVDMPLLPGHNKSLKDEMKRAEERTHGLRDWAAGETGYRWPLIPSTPSASGGGGSTGGRMQMEAGRRPPHCRRDRRRLLRSSAR